MDPALTGIHSWSSWIEHQRLHYCWGLVCYKKQLALGALITTDGDRMIQQNLVNLKIHPMPQIQIVLISDGI